MPSGKSHNKINIVFLFVFLIGMFTIGFVSIEFSTYFVLGYLFGTYLCGPDLDTKSSLYKRWGAFRFIWYPYRKFLPHRSILTHGIIIGDIVRLSYLALWLTPLILINNSWINDFAINFYLNNHYAVWFFPLGVMLSSTVHIASDVIVSTKKRLFK